MPVSTKPILLLVDSRSASLERLKAHFRSSAPLIELIAVEHAAKAMEVVVQRPVDAVLADAELSDMSGVALLAMIKKVRPAVTAMILSDPAESELHRLSRKLGEAHYFDKTDDLGALVARVNSCLFEEPVGFRGMLENLELPDVIQLLCTRRDSVRVRIVSEHNTGYVVIENGEIVHARTNTRQGEEAFYELFGWKGGVFERKPMVRGEPRTINAPWQKLLLEASRRQDERPAAPSPAAPARATQSGLCPAPPPIAPAVLDSSTVSNTVATVSAATDDSQAGLTTRELTRSATAATDAGGKDPETTKTRTRADWQARAHVPRRADDRKLRLRARAESLLTYVAAAGIAWAGFVGISWLRVSDEGQKWVRGLLNLGKPAHEFVRGLPAPALPIAADVDTLRPDAAAGICQVRIAPLKEFSESGSVVALSADVFDALGLRANPWVEVITPAGRKMGAYAIRKKADNATIFLRKTMALALHVETYPTSYVRVRPVALSPDALAKGQIAFASSRPLAPAFCEYWYTVGISLDVMNQARLAPGSYAIVKGPEGFQSVQIQVMDRGNPDEIWLSDSVREAIGVEGAADRVVLYPKDYVWIESARPARTARR
jgi:DNA-binding LytR/AlgR family response regulator